MTIIFSAPRDVTIFFLLSFAEYDRENRENTPDEQGDVLPFANSEIPEEIRASTRALQEIKKYAQSPLDFER